MRSILDQELCYQSGLSTPHVHHLHLGKVSRVILVEGELLATGHKDKPLAVSQLVIAPLNFQQRHG